ncbi:MAG: Protein of unknown function (DUF1587)/Protein of unknown function (DUF1592)/Protein of unknown [Phycisphaerales bacterium]|nr:Protein of unknown function (DUF1587)/Protein of unknown function (DUF1592)/Protein of unknown [Phycisphaerales bacterium]
MPSPLLCFAVRRLRAAAILGCTTVAVLIALGLTTHAASDAAAHSPPLGFEKDARPILADACFACHNEKKHKGHVDFTAFKDEKSVLRQRKVWRKAIEQIEAMEMPPEDEKQLSPEQKATLLAWMKQAANYVDCDRPAGIDPGPAPVRRLDRAEYNNTIRDLLGIDFDAGDAVGMPDEMSGSSYANLANGLILPPTLMDKYFASAEKVLDIVIGPADGGSPPQLEDKQKKQAKKAFDALFIARPGADSPPREAARKVLERFARRAYRRPLREGEADRLLTLFDLSQADGEKFELSVRLACKAVLVSPHFLMRVEQERPSTNGKAATGLDDYELATRLSYFLWSSMPDEPLFELAGEHKLSDPSALEQQVRRMIADPKAKALTDQFGIQWLQTRKVMTARPSTEFFPTFTNDLRQAMFDESYTFFDKLREEDRSVLDLLNADYTYVNEELARHYGIPDVKGKELRKVSLKPEYHRGGLLGMGSMLSLTSHTFRTSPTLRGKYGLEVIFGTPPPPPPPNAGGMFNNEKRGEAKSFRELMAMHASQPACASCHKRIDPLGYGLENFDAVGRWRNDAGGRPLDNDGILPSGEKFVGPMELREVVLKHQDEFVHNLAEQMLTYALGRDLEYYDECAVRDVTQCLQQNGYRFSSLVLGIVKSHPFQHRRASNAMLDD